MSRSALERRFQQAFALHGAGRHAEALGHYDAVLSYEPRHAAALHYSALILQGGGRGTEALERIERSLAIDAGVPDAWSNAGLIRMAHGRAAEALHAFERALRLEPTLVDAWLHLSSLRLRTGDPVAAETAARRALAVASSPVAWFHLALALQDQRRAAEALQALDRLAASGPVDRADAALPGLRVQLLLDVGQHDAARRLLDDTLALLDDPTLRVERARVRDADRDDVGAIDDYRAALRLDPDHEIALSEIVFLMKRRARWEGLPALRAAFRDAVLARDGRVPSHLTPFSFLSDPSSRAEQRVAAERWSRRFRGVDASRRPLSSGRLRIGYLSADLHAHATGVLAVGLFEHHDRERFEVFAYSTGPDDGSALRGRLVAAFDRFVDARGWTEARVAAAIEADGIDILVDLKGHTERAPTGVMALRPAPIAVSYLGYPGTMGADFIDYLIGDPIVTPLAHAADYAETLVQLPHAYQVNDDRRTIGIAPTRVELGLPMDAVVFCCFNQPWKLNAAVLDAWAAILRAAPRSVLWLLARDDDTGLRERLRQAAAARGIDPQRVVFAAPRPHADYLALYRRADLFLDTWPYNAHTTAADALWAGCPVLTFLGETFAGRVAASLVTAAFLPQCVAVDRDDYVGRASRWGNDPVKLAALRRPLETGRDAAKLFDTAASTRALERAYAAMARQFDSGRREAIVISASD